MSNSYFLIASDDRIHELPADRGIMLGRAPINPIVLNDRLISRVHASIAPSPAGPVLTDRDSANGTQVNGLPVQETVLKHGDTIRIGKFVFHVFRGSRPEAEQWLTRRSAGTKTDQTLTDLNLHQLRPTDMMGDLGAFNIVALLQSLVDQKQNGALALSHHGQPLGKIFLTNGLIVCAETAAGLKGKEAFFELATTAAGQFILRATERPPTLAIMEDPANLLAQVRQRFDGARGTAVRATNVPHPFAGAVR